MRSLDSGAQSERRRRVVSLRKRGRTYAEIAEECELSVTGVFNICRRYESEGVAGLTNKTPGRREGEQRTLTATQEAAIRKLICDKAPDQLKMPFALWNRSAVGQLVQAQFGIKLPVRSVGNYLQRWGFTPQKPMKKAYEQRPEAVRHWLDQEYPAIAVRTKKEGAEIHWGDETGLRSDDVRGRGYAPKGQTPVVRVPNKREGLSLISTVTNQGRVRWKVFEGALNADLLIDFFKRLIKDAGRKVFVILDNLKVHHARTVNQWLALHTDQIEVFYLPSYSPELNPDECLNADLKAAVTTQAPARSKGQLRKAAISHMHKLQKSPARVRIECPERRNQVSRRYSPSCASVCGAGSGHDTLRTAAASTRQRRCRTSPRRVPSSFQTGPPVTAQIRMSNGYARTTGRLHPHMNGSLSRTLPSCSAGAFGSFGEP